jgi:hypothetical protein
MEQAVTGPDGRYEFNALPLFTGVLLVRDEENPLDYGDFFDLYLPYTVQHNDTVNIWLIPDYDLDTEMYPDFFNFFRHMTDTYNNIYSNILRTWELPLDFYVKPFVHNDLDYGETIADVLNELEAVTGLDLFNLVDSPPDVGVRTEYQADLYADNYHVEERTADTKVPIKGLITFRTTYTPATISVFEKIIRHEVGHVLAMKHSADRAHLMYGGVDINPSVLYFTSDELALLHAMYNIPRLFLISNYKEK